MGATTKVRATIMGASLPSKEMTGRISIMEKAEFVEGSRAEKKKEEGAVKKVSETGMIKNWLTTNQNLSHVKILHNFIVY